LQQKPHLRGGGHEATRIIDVAQAMETGLGNGNAREVHSTTVGMGQGYNSRPTERAQREAVSVPDAPGRTGCRKLVSDPGSPPIFAYGL
jgi:hypothetical protein